MPATPAAPVPSPSPATVRALSASAVCVVVLVELERLVGAAVSPSGLSRSLSGLLGPTGPWQRDAWDVWSASTATDAVVRVLVAHLVVDLAFVAVYAGLLLRWARFLRRTASGAPDVVTRVVPGAAVAVAGLDVAEDGVLLAATRRLADGPVPDLLAGALAALTGAKWLAVAVLLVASWVAARRRFGSDRSTAPPLVRLGRAAAAAARAVAYQRLSLLVVVVVGVLSVVPAPNIWDQLPDAQRRWVDARPADLVHLTLALLGTVALFGQLFVLGRRRADRAWATHATGAVPDAPTPWWLWLAWPVLTSAVALALVVSGNAEDVDALPLAVFLGVYAALLGGSLALRRSRWRPRPVDPRPRDEAHAHRVRRAGDALATAVLVLAGLGLVRSFCAPLVLPPLDPGAGSLAAAVSDGALLGRGRWAFQLVLAVLGVALAVGAPSLTRRVGRRVPLPSARVRRSAVGPRQRLVAAAVGAAAVAVLAVFARWPLQVAPAVGVVFTVQAVLGAWVVVVGLAVVRLQESQPLEVFRLLRLRATPVLTVLVLVPLLVSQRGGDPDLHAVRRLPAPAGADAGTPVRPDVEAALAAWAATSAACDRPGASADDPAVRPVLLVAAAGGGIRAATWTAGVLQVLADAPCGAAATWLSSGVSGGSLGLSLARRPDPLAAAGALSAPDALSAAIAGLTVGDVLGGATGVRVPAAGTGGRWHDRAGLIETVWERQAPALAEPFDAAPAGPGGALLLGATAAGPGCRVLVGQVDVSPADPSADCRERSGRLAVSLDLPDLYPCPPALSWATAALLSARFPTLTPAGRYPGEPAAGCPAAPRPLQLVDGGYAERTGLGTLADLAPDLMNAVRRWNADAVAGSGEPVLVPVVVLLDSSSRADVAPPASPLAAELLVPLAGLRARSLQTDPIAWLQRLGSSVASPCPEPVAPGCAAAVRAVHDPLTGGVVVVSPQTEPAVDAPLGWTLSVDSRVRLADAVAVQAHPSCVDRPRLGGYSCLGRLRQVLDP